VLADLGEDELQCWGVETMQGSDGEVLGALPSAAHFLHQSGPQALSFWDDWLGAVMFTS
jgi:hypothetical protein